MMRRLLGALGAAGLLAPPLAACFSDRGGGTAPTGVCEALLDPSQYGSTVIATSGFAFTPGTVRTAVGGRVTWLNCEPGGTPAHTTTADGGTWTSTPLEPGASYTFTFNTPGTFAYHCEPHPFMTAVIEVAP